MTARRHFPCKPEAVTAARRYVRDVLRDRPDEVIEAAELMASELATNCVRHARTAFELSIEVGAEIRVEVRDTGSGRPQVLSPAAEEPSGRGLLIIDSLSDEWGVIPGAQGKAVWFTIAEPAATGESTRGARRRRSAPKSRDVSARPPIVNLWRHTLALVGLRRG